MEKDVETQRKEKIPEEESKIRGWEEERGGREQAETKRGRGRKEI